MKRQDFLKIALLSPLAVVASPVKKPAPEIFGSGVGGVKYTDGGDGGLVIYKTASMGPTESYGGTAVQCRRCYFFWPSYIKECPNCCTHNAKDCVDKFISEMIKATG